MGVAVIVGVSEGLGQSLCRTFVDRGYAVVALARSTERSGDPDPVRSVVCDVCDPASVRRAFETVEATEGVPDVVVHNPGAFSHGPFLETTLEDFERAWQVSARGAWLVARQVLPAMLARESGTLVFSGATASLRGSAKFSALASSKFALRGLAQSLAREFGPRGIHVAHAVLDGVIWCAWTAERFGVERDRALDPDAIAGAYADLCEQRPSAWTHELDLRPFSEKF